MSIISATSNQNNTNNNAFIDANNLKISENLNVSTFNNNVHNHSNYFTNAINVPLVRKEILERKFSTQKYDDKYIVKCIQRDILDFQEYTKDQIRKNRVLIDELIRLVKQSVSDSIPDYEVNLYGSHATNLCLPWSDLDIVLVNKKVVFSNNYAALQSLYLTLYDKPWIKSIKFIDGALIPIIKLTVSEEFNNMQMDISLQDAKHFGLKCVELVKSFMIEYESLEPLIFSLKNLLKNANLNDPYTVNNNSLILFCLFTFIFYMN